jgi:hypothetical protein
MSRRPMRYRAPRVAGLPFKSSFASGAPQLGNGAWASVYCFSPQNGMAVERSHEE